MEECHLVTGGAGFIGSNYVRSLLASRSHRVVIVDKLTYAGNLATIRDLLDSPRVDFVEADIADHDTIHALIQNCRPSAILNFAAESHVDRSIESPRHFLHSNTVGAFELLENARHYFAGLPEPDRASFRFLQVSTDEVFGSLGPEGSFSEDTPYAPRSPYSATKASADHLTRAYHETYGLPVLITNCSNNFGPFQFPEKLIPLLTLNALAGKALPVYGRGENVRDWLHVQDHCEAITAVLERGEPGRTYNVGTRNELKNIDVVYAICDVLDSLRPPAKNPRMAASGKTSYRALVEFVQDRPGHDFRYSIDPTRIESELGWRARREFGESLRETVKWYLENQDWCQEVQAGVYTGERLGLDGHPRPPTPEVDA